MCAVFNKCLCTGVAIEISLAKDRSLSVVITGKEDAVKMARKLVLQQLQTQVVRLRHLLAHQIKSLKQFMNVVEQFVIIVE